VEKTNAAALEGKLALVEEPIDNAAPSGAVKINGQLWTARTENPVDRPAKGDWVEIIRVEGAKLICKPRN
jgi:membrane protein implicated in regulation of membrane protease activity